MSEIRKWLQAIGLDQYADAFETNDIDMELLRKVDDQTLKDIGMSSAGHRLRVRSAIAEHSSSGASGLSAGGSSSTTEDSRATAERRQLGADFLTSRVLTPRSRPSASASVAAVNNAAGVAAVGRWVRIAPCCRARARRESRLRWPSCEIATRH